MDTGFRRYDDKEEKLFGTRFATQCRKISFVRGLTWVVQ